MEVEKIMELKDLIIGLLGSGWFCSYCVFDNRLQICLMFIVITLCIIGLLKEVERMWNEMIHRKEHRND